MKLNFCAIILINLFSALLSSIAYGQISADNAIVALTDYPSGAKNDTIFCFRQGFPMIIKYGDGVLGSSLTWYRHNPEDNTWNEVVQNGGPQLNVSSEGGYRVVAEEEGTEVADRRFWVYNSQAITEVEAGVVDENCSKVELSVSATTNPLYYIDPLSGVEVALSYQLSFEWKTVPEGEMQLSGESVTFDAPYEDLIYVVTVKDRFENSLNDSVNYSAIAVMADFEVESMKDTVLNERHDEIQGSAPYEIRFTDTSKGKVSAREWTFGTLGRSIDQDPLFVFAEAGLHEVTLYVLNRESGCESFSDVFEVNITESELEVPNVFTPNGDGINDEFRVAYKSLKKFEMVVFNRWGRKVFESKDPAVGWDGSGQAPGVYYYYIYGEGYNEGEVYKKGGAVHLIRGK
ncbi:gliding motility-associated C-terminal domain-containing protein [Thermophagus sp. OGC60D27]|uniref:T9SS type B sorting domain-containing protein n=1 Tax=Thermophagus sp. OGC60D27 TaxID=3458415 RepID=UPI00403808D5